jgi:asparagine synthase (glutamine-hydrolysing)
LWDRLEHRGVVAADRIGIMPLFVLPGDGALVFADSPAGIRRLSPSDLRLNDQSLFDYLYFHMVPAPGCVFERVVRLQPGEYVEWRDGALTHSRYWSMRFEETATADFPSLKNDFLAALREGVQGTSVGQEQRVPQRRHGQLDDRRLDGRDPGRARARTRSASRRGLRRDGYARIAARHFAPTTTVLRPRMTSWNSMPSWRRHDQPFGNSSAVPLLLRQAREGRRRRSHDRRRRRRQLFGGNVRYAKQYVFSFTSGFRRR